MKEIDFLKVISKIVGDNKLKLDTKIRNIKKWDSLTTVRIFIEFEKINKSKTPISKIKNIETLKDFFLKLKN
jgi:hypothetical protein